VGTADGAPVGASVMVVLVVTVLDVVVRDVVVIVVVLDDG